MKPIKNTNIIESPIWSPTSKYLWTKKQVKDWIQYYFNSNDGLSVACYSISGNRNLLWEIEYEPVKHLGLYKVQFKKHEKMP